jgi:hypothetical protein
MLLCPMDTAGKRTLAAPLVLQHSDKESQREPNWRALGVASTASLLCSPFSYVILTQKPRDRLSGRPFPIEHAYHLAGGQATLLFQRFIHRLDFMRSLLYRL